MRAACEAPSAKRSPSVGANDRGTWPREANQSSGTPNTTPMARPAMRWLHSSQKMSLNSASVLRTRGRGVTRRGYRHTTSMAAAHVGMEPLILGKPLVLGELGEPLLVGKGRQAALRSPVSHREAGARQACYAAEDDHAEHRCAAPHQPPAHRLWRWRLWRRGRCGCALRRKQPHVGSEAPQLGPHPLPWAEVARYLSMSA